MHVLGLQRALPESRYVSMTQRDADAARDQGRRRDRAPGHGGRGGRRELRGHRAGPLRGAARERDRRRPRRLPARARPLPGRLHRRRLGPERRQPAPRDERAGDRGRATWSCSTSAGSRTATAPTRRRTVHVGEPTDEERKVHEIVRASPAGRLRGRPPRRRLPGDRPRGAQGDRRRRLRRVLHPPRRARHRPDHPRAAVHGRGRDAPDRARHVLLDRARASTCPAASACGSRTSSSPPRTAAGGSTTPTARCGSSPEGGTQ